jgi:hypothetical protein
MALLALAIVVPAASAHPGFGFRGYYGGPYYGPAYYGWYGPGWYGPGYYGGYAVEQIPNVGKVKFETKVKDASVFVDGGYAGTVKQLGTFPLRPGTHDLELRNPSGQTMLQEKVDIVAGKTIKLGAR